MKRNRFILSVLGVAAVPFVSNAQAFVNAVREGKGFKVGAGEGRYHGHIQLKGVNANILDVKICGKDTDGGLPRRHQRI